MKNNIHNASDTELNNTELKNIEHQSLEYIDMQIVDMYYQVIKHILDDSAENNELKRFFEDVEKILHLLKDKVMISILCEKVYSIEKYRDVLKTLSTKLNLHYKSEFIFNNIRNHGYHVYLKPLLKSLYQKWLDDYGIMKAQLITAIACDNEEIKALEKELSEYYKKKVIVQNTVHPRTLGGCKLKVNGALIDLSYSTMLNKLLKNIEQTDII